MRVHVGPYFKSPYGAGGVDAGGTQDVRVGLIPVKGCQRSTEL